MDGEIRAEELRDLIESDDDVRVVDIRQPGAFERGHIPGSENIPFAELPQCVGRLDGANRVVTVCPVGKSSIQAARLIGSYEGTGGATVESLADGIEGWEFGFEARGDAEAGERLRQESASDGTASDDGSSDEGDGGTAETANEGPDAPF